MKKKREKISKFLKRKCTIELENYIRKIDKKATRR